MMYRCDILRRGEERGGRGEREGGGGCHTVAVRVPGGGGLPGAHTHFVCPNISLGDIQNMPTLWVLALFGNFYKFGFHVQTCRH